MVAKVHAVDPDVVGLQEFATGSESAGWIEQHLPGYTWVHGPDNHALMVRTSRFEIVATGEHQLNVAGQEGAIDSRFADWARLRDRSSGRTLLVLNVHAHAWQSETLARVRSLAIGRLVALVRELDPGLKEPLVLLGDFNARSNDKRPLWGDHLRKLAAAGLVDAARLAEHDSSDVVGANSLNRMVAKVAGQDVARAVQRSGSHIDYVWVPKGTRVSTWEVLSGPGVTWRNISGARVPMWTGIIPSDHSPVAAELRFD
jgi:endonuclease/exonuclease/phosphatase family metal-dependent hydrolase